MFGPPFLRTREVAFDKTRSSKLGSLSPPGQD
jgi:hypothetical protein